MNKKILTLTLLTTLLVTQAQDAKATEKKLTGADRMKAMMRGGSAQTPVIHSPEALNLGDQPKPASDLKITPKLTEGGSTPSTPIKTASSVDQSQQLLRVSPKQNEDLQKISRSSAESLGVAEERDRLKMQLVEVEERAREEREKIERKILTVASEAESAKKALEEKLNILKEHAAAEQAAAKKREEEQNVSFLAQMEKAKQIAQEREEALQREFDRKLEAALKEQNEMHLGVWNQIVAGLFTLEQKDSQSKTALPATLGTLKLLLEDELISNESGSKTVKLVFPKEFK